MKRILTICLLFCAAFPSISQNIDSLKEVLKRNDLSSDERSFTLLMVGEYVSFDNPMEAETYVEKALAIASIEKDSMRIMYSYDLLSRLKTIQGKHSEALHVDLKLLKLGEGMSNEEIIGNALNNIGDDYFYQGAYSQAYDHYQRSRSKALESEDSLLLAITTFNLGQVLNEQRQYDRAREFLEEGRTLSEIIGDDEGVVYCDLELAEIDLKQGKYDAAYSKLIDAEEIVNKNEYRDLQREVYAHLAKLFEKQRSYTSALDYYSKLEEVQTRLGNQSGLGESYLGKGSVWMALMDFGQSEMYLNKSIDLAEDSDNAELLRDSYLSLSALREKQGRYSEALTLHREYKYLDDSLTNLSRDEQFSNIQLMYETQQRDAEIQLMRERQEQQNLQLSSEQFKNNILVVILGMLAVILLILYRGSVKRKRINSLLLVQKEEIEEKTREMEGLLTMKDKFLSIISHDLRSPINTLVGMLDMYHKGHLTKEETRQLFGSLKNRLDNTRTLLDNLLDWTLLQMDELVIRMQPLNLQKIVEANIEFFKETNDKHIIFFNKVPENTMVLADQNMLDLVLRNLIVNSLKFTQEGGFIETDSEKGKDGHITVSLADNGVGMSQEQCEKLFDQSTLISTPGTANEKGTGLGLKLCREFVGRMGGTISVTSKVEEGSVFKFTLKIPRQA